MDTETQQVLQFLVGRPLDRFTIMEMTEVYSVHEDGRRIEPAVGCFRDADVASAFALENGLKTRITCVLTDGDMGFYMTAGPSAVLLDDVAVKAKMREDVLANLSPWQRKLLGL